MVVAPAAMAGVRWFAGAPSLSTPRLFWGARRPSGDTAHSEFGASRAGANCTLVGQIVCSSACHGSKLHQIAMSRQPRGAGCRRTSVRSSWRRRRLSRSLRAVRQARGPHPPPSPPKLSPALQALRKLPRAPRNWPLLHRFRPLGATTSRHLHRAPASRCRSLPSTSIQHAVTASVSTRTAGRS